MNYIDVLKDNYTTKIRNYITMADDDYVNDDPLPTFVPTFSPPSYKPTVAPVPAPTYIPTFEPTVSAPTTNASVSAPTNAPVPPPTRKPTQTPTRTPTRIPTAKPSIAPSAAPTIDPSIDPSAAPTTANPSIDPSAAPTAGPSINPSVAPTIDPTLAPTVESTPVHTYLRTAKPSFSLTSKPTFSLTLFPSFFPSLAAIDIKTKDRVNNILQLHNEFLRNSGELQDIVQTLLIIDNPTEYQINTIHKSLNNYKNSLGDNTLWLFIAIDHLQQGLENSEKLGRIGLTELANNFNTECLDGGSNHVVTINSALGSRNISNVIYDGAKDITGVIGNHTLQGITLINITTYGFNSISAKFSSLDVAYSNAIGITPSLFSAGITVNACDDNYNIDKIIYKASNPLSIVDYPNGFMACSNWVHNTDEHYITKTTAEDCVYVVAKNALSTCVQYLGINELHDEL